MGKGLKAIVKECRCLLERDVQEQAHYAPNSHKARPDNATQNNALAALLELAVLRCFEEQFEAIAPPLSVAADASDIETLRSILKCFRKNVQETLSISLPFCEWCHLKLSSATLHTLLHHLTESISPEEWRSEHILGWIYQAFHEETPAQKQHGRFYTPEAVADTIVTQAFDELFNGDENLGFENMTILDLGCGAGMFALRAFDQLYERYQQEVALRGHHLKGGVHLRSRGIRLNIPQQILEQHLFLIDNDPWACRIAAINLLLKAKRVDPACRIRHLNIFWGDALQRWEQGDGTPLPPPRRERLSFAPSQEENGLKELFARRYDAVVGNPPYIVINQLRAPQALVQLYKSYTSAAFKINTFPLFIERGLGLLKAHGVLGMVVPNTVFTQMYFEPLRRYILNTSKILRMLDTKRVFENAFVENCILLLQQESDPRERSGHIIDCVPASSNGNSAAHQGAPHRIAQHHLENSPFKMFHLSLTEPVLELIEQLACGNPRLGEICESHDGVNPGNAKQKLIVSEPVDDTCKKILNGKNIGRYWLRWDGLYVRYNRALLTKGDNVRWGHRAALNSAKILTRQTADRLIGTFDPGGYYVTNSIHTTVLQGGIREFQLKYVLALLNSKLLSFYYRTLFPEAGQVFSQVKLINLRQLPLKAIAPEKQHEIVRAVDHLLQINISREDKRQSEEPSHSPACSEDAEWRACRVREIDDRLDQMVYEAYQLTPEQIGMVEQEFGKGIGLFPKVPADELAKELPFSIFHKLYCQQAWSIFQMAEQYEVHPESLVQLRRQYHLS